MSPGIRLGVHWFLAAIIVAVAVVLLLTSTGTLSTAILAVAGWVANNLGMNSAYQLRRADRVRHRMGRRGLR